jgi:hypothetical protein
MSSFDARNLEFVKSSKHPLIKGPQWFILADDAS